MSNSCRIFKSKSFCFGSSHFLSNRESRSSSADLAIRKGAKIQNIIFPSNRYGIKMTSSNPSEFWTSENEFDIAQIITKRVLFSFYLWIGRLTSIQVILTFLSLGFGLPLLIFMMALVSKTKEKIQRKQRFLVKLERRKRIKRQDKLKLMSKNLLRE